MITSLLLLSTSRPLAATTELGPIAATQQQNEWSYSSEFNIKMHGQRNGVWEYGYYDRNTYTFNFFNKQIEEWHGVQNLHAMYRGGPDWNMVHLARNASANLIDLEPTLKWRGHDCSAHPGAGGEAAVITFVAPRSGKYNLNFEISGLDDMATTSALLVLNHSTKLGQQEIKGAGTPKGGISWKKTDYRIDLSAGQKLSFAITDGGNTNKSDSTKIALVVSEVTASE
jgi:hypothetical protein